MSEIICNRCGWKTNTTLCDWVDCIETGKAYRCYARWDEVSKCWVDGCAMDDEDVDKFSIDFAKKAILGKENKMLQIEIKVNNCLVRFVEVVNVTGTDAIEATYEATYLGIKYRFNHIKLDGVLVCAVKALQAIIDKENEKRREND